jgi:hypothetical protein
MAQAFHAPCDHRVDIDIAVVAVCRKVAQKLRIGLAGLEQLGGDRIQLPEAVIAEDDVQLLVSVDECAGHVVQHQVKFGFLARQLLLRLLLARDVGHHSDRAAAGRLATIDAIAAAVRCGVLKTLAGRVAQTFHTPRDHHVDVAFAVVAVCREVAQELRIGLARAKQPFRDGIHLPEAIVTENDIQVVVGIDQRARHVVERDLQITVRGGSRTLQRFVHRTPSTSVRHPRPQANPASRARPPAANHRIAGRYRPPCPGYNQPRVSIFWHRSKRPIIALDQRFACQK